MTERNCQWKERRQPSCAVVGENPPKREYRTYWMKRGTPGTTPDRIHSPIRWRDWGSAFARPANLQKKELKGDAATCRRNPKSKPIANPMLRTTSASSWVEERRRDSAVDGAPSRLQGGAGAQMADEGPLLLDGVKPRATRGGRLERGARGHKTSSRRPVDRPACLRRDGTCPGELPWKVSGGEYSFPIHGRRIDHVPDVILETSSGTMHQRGKTR